MVEEIEPDILALLLGKRSLTWKSFLGNMVGNWLKTSITTGPILYISTNKSLVILVYS